MAFLMSVVEVQSRRLTGWGNTTPSLCRTATLTPDSAGRILDLVDGRGVTMRGLGRAYGDAALNGGGLVLELGGNVDQVVLDEATGLIRCPAGVSLDNLIAFIVPRGFFVPVTPGTRFVTVGGAVASDIHGKNHHVDGSFGSHVERLTLLLADGSIVEVSPDRDAELFWATVGGMGLTGAILEVTFRTLRIETSKCTVSTRRCHNLDELLAEMADHDEEHRYSVAWTDLLAQGSALGRSILWRGDHTTRDELESDSDVLRYETRNLGSIPNVIPAPGLVNKWTSRLFNEMWYRKAPRRRDGEIKSIPAFFHPLDSVGDWNRLYGPGGFVQYQFCVPFGAEDTLRATINEISRSGCASPLVVLKRFGSGNPGMLSFPTAGWTLTVDIAARVDGLATLLRKLDDMVLQVGGRHYLAKDAHMSPKTLEQEYPRLGEWRAVKRRVDPEGMWTSDLARRLELTN